ncbi:MAG: UvrD-helicase domain-containing protein [Planctomycetes bacterium]|nr:UvrD-helicase domain-containing protein [Planctomycetota bacterium]
MSNLLDGLNPEQKRAVETTEGPVLVLAGAGTGKTRVITVRIAHMLTKGTAPERILAMTFTNKAAGEMRERVSGTAGGVAAKKITCGTFHAFCVRALREYADRIGYPRDFAIADDSDQLSAVKSALRELRVPDAVIHPNFAKSRISLLKNQLATYDTPGDSDKDELIARAWKRYDDQMRRSRSMDFDDLLVKMLELLRKHHDVRERFRVRFRYVLVDEYQDTNAPQFEIIREIAGEHRNLCVVGDDDQSIYGFRGADVRKILEFEKSFPGAAVVRLETNYRSTEPILAAANAVIRCNPSRHDKQLRSTNGDGPPVAVIEKDDEEGEAAFVAQEIQQGVQRGRVKYGDFAVLLRAAVQARALEMAFRARAIPYVLIGGMSFFDRKEVRDVLSFVRLTINRDDEVSLLRIINTPPRGVGDASVDRVLEFATEHGISAGAAFERGSEIERVPGETVTAVAHLRAKLDSLGLERPGKNLVDWMKRLIRAVDYSAELERCYPEQRDRDTRWAAVMEVVNVAENYSARTDAPTVQGFLEEITMKGEGMRDSKEKKRDVVTLMTLHAAKGLEFPCVYLVGMEEGIMPHARAVKDGTIEEERRLMYVGITRARRVLTVTWANERAKYGRRTATNPSRFIFEMSGTKPPPGWKPATAAEPDDDDAPRAGSKSGKPGAPARGGKPKGGKSAQRRYGGPSRGPR